MLVFIKSSADWRCEAECVVLFIAIEVEEENVPWAAAGSNVNIQLTSIDPVNLIVGSVLCPPADLVPLATSFLARVIVFDIQVPITAGSSVLPLNFISLKNSVLMNVYPD